MEKKETPTSRVLHPKRKSAREKKESYQDSTSEPDKLKLKDKRKKDKIINKALKGNGIKFKSNLFSTMSLPFDFASGVIQPKDALLIRKSALLRHVSSFQNLCTTMEEPDRITALTWHFNNPHLLAMASKDGSFTVGSVVSGWKEIMQETGKGAGGSVNVIKFNPMDPFNVYMTSLEGEFRKVNYQTKRAEVMLRTDKYNIWFVSFDINTQNKILAVGDTTGHLTMLSKDGIKIGSYKLHKTAKIAYTEFSKRDPNLICTAANDKMVKLWDVRIFGEEIPEPLFFLPHQKPINSATFSCTDGSRLLTTDQGEEINVYRAPLFHLERSILHPHRFFQYISPIRASWHPLDDIIVIGRYPKKGSTDDIRSTDFIDPNTGEVVHQLLEHKNNISIKSMNEFNILGDTLASSAGRSVILWRNFNVSKI